MAPIDVSLAATPGRAVPHAGLKSIVTEPLVYLLDMDVTVEPSNDGRTVTVRVLENDADARGEKAPIQGALVRAVSHGGRVLAEAKTDAFGVTGLPLPVDVPPEEIVLAAQHESFNARHLRLDGTNVVEDVRRVLFGGTG